MKCKSIGIVKSPVKEGVDKGWGEVISELHINEQFADGLNAIDSLSHIIVVFEMHKSTWNPRTDLVRRPQGRADMPLIGIFAQRAKHRPNPIGIAVVQLLGAKRSVLKIKGLDAIDGTPILDLKPYFPRYDRVAEATTPEWVDRIITGYF